MKLTTNINYITDKTKMIKVGDIYIQRTNAQCFPRKHGFAPSSLKEKFWTVTEVHHEPDRTTLETEGKSPVTLRGCATHKFFLIPQHREQGYSRTIESKECFNFPLKKYNDAKPWMQNFHRKLGYEVPRSRPGDDPILARAQQSTPTIVISATATPTEETEVTTPKRKRKPPECPPAPKKRKVGRFIVTEKEILASTHRV